MAELDSNRAAEVTIGTQPDPSGAPVVTVSGELDISNADKLAATVARLAEERPPRVVFDLSGLRYMDSAGIAVLLDAAARVGAVQIREPSAAVRRVIEVTGVADVLPIQP